MVLITIVTGAYKSTYNWGASHCRVYEIIHVASYHDVVLNPELTVDSMTSASAVPSTPNFAESPTD